MKKSKIRVGWVDGCFLLSQIKVFNDADNKIFDVLVQRREAILKVTKYKKENNLPI